MKKWVCFVLGIITGVIVTILFAITYVSLHTSTSQEPTSELSPEEQSGIRYYDSPGEVIKESSFQVFQVLADNAALVHGKQTSENMYMGTIYVIVHDDGKLYYDNQIVKVPKGKVVRMMGTYTYTTPKGMEKTVPIIKIMDH